MSKAPLSESSCASSAALSRRQLLAGAGALTGSLLVGWRANDAKAGAHAGVSEAELTGWLRINPDNTVTVYCAMAEMGQGVMTSLGALAAEELEVDWSSVDVIMPDSHPRFRTARGRRITGNSASVMSNFKPLREAGAAARSMLQTAAAKQWQVPAAECVAAAGAISHAASGRTATYAQLAAAAATLPVPEKFELKQPADWTLIGQRLPRVDIEAKVSGAAVFGADVDLPGLQVATIMACPRFGGSLASVDPAPAMAIKGVTQVVSLDTAVAVVADGYWNAQLGLQALQPEWDMSTAVTDDAEAISAAQLQALDGPAKVGKATGDTATAFATAAQVVTADYQVPFLAHMCMEPMNATVKIAGDSAELWVPTQAETDTVRAIAGALAIAPENVMVHSTLLGGGFGRRSYTDFALQAALIAKAVDGGPVKLIWSREEDMRQDKYRPAMSARYRGALNADGSVAALEVTATGPSLIDDFKLPPKLDSVINVMGLAGDGYKLEHQKLSYARLDAGVPIGIWRATLLSENGFFAESFVDELATAGKRSPLAIRRELTGDNAAGQAALDLLEELFDFGPRGAPGQAWGIAMATGWNCTVAAAMEVTRISASEFRINDVACALHCGTAINPAVVESQIQGGFLFGLDAALFGEARVTNGAMVRGNFDTQPALRMNQAPRVRAAIVPSTAPPGGVGEITTAISAPVLANALAAAGMPRVRQLPFAKAGMRLIS